jgi:hypothetical protein
VKLNDLVDQIYPPIKVRGDGTLAEPFDIGMPVDEQFNDYNYWRSPLEHTSIEIPIPMSQKNGKRASSSGQRKSPVQGRNLEDKEDASETKFDREQEDWDEEEEGDEEEDDEDEDEDEDEEEDLELEGVGSYPYL